MRVRTETRVRDSISKAALEVAGSSNDSLPLEPGLLKSALLRDVLKVRTRFDAVGQGRPEEVVRQQALSGGAEALVPVLGEKCYADAVGDGKRAVGAELRNNEVHAMNPVDVPSGSATMTTESSVPR